MQTQIQNNELQKRIRRQADKVARMHHQHKEGSQVIIPVSENKRSKAIVLMNLRRKVLCVFDCGGGTDLRLLYPSEVEPFSNPWGLA